MPKVFRPQACLRRLSVVVFALLSFPFPHFEAKKIESSRKIDTSRRTLNAPWIGHAVNPFFAGNRTNWPCPQIQKPGYYGLFIVSIGMCFLKALRANKLRITSVYRSISIFVFKQNSKCPFYASWSKAGAGANSLIQNLLLKTKFLNDNKP